MVLFKSCHCVGVIAQSFFDYVGGLIIASQPDDFRWRAVESRHVGESTSCETKVKPLNFAYSQMTRSSASSIPSKRT